MPKILSSGITQWSGTVDPMLLIYAVPLATGAMLTALLIDIHTAIVFTVITSLVSGVWLDNPLYSIYVFASGLTAAFGVIRCKKRSAIWRAGLYVSLVNVSTALMITLFEGHILSIDPLIILGAALANGIVVAMLVSALLPPFEHLFNLRFIPDKVFVQDYQKQTNNKE
jgi:membrane-associated HD superfamily phosphohydrolase